MKSADIAAPAPLPHVAAALSARKKIRVLVIGSGSIFGRQHRNYPAELEALLKKTFKGLHVVTINRSVSGEVASTTAYRLQSLVGLEQPDLVIWQVGTNDALARIPTEDFEATMKEALTWLKEHQVDVALVGLQYSPRVAGDKHYSAIRNVLRAVAAAENVLLIRRFEAMQFIEKARSDAVDLDGSLPSDDVSNRCLAEHLARAVVVNSFLK